MLSNQQKCMLNGSNYTERQYPVAGIVAASILLYLAPFVTSLLAIVSMAICLYRVIRYDARVFAIDYCILVPLASLSKFQGGVALLIYLVILGGIWYFIRNGFYADISSATLIVVLVYMLMRMQFDVNALVLSFGQLFVLFVLLPQQNSDSAVVATKGFCVSLVLSSFYALLLRNTRQLVPIRGMEGAAFWGSTTVRFQGLMKDPNYYMTMLIIGLALLMKLKDSNRIGSMQFIIMGLCMTVFGTLTYSKTFFLAFIILGGLYIFLQFQKKNSIRGMIISIVAVVIFFVLVNMDNSPFAVVLERLRSANNISEFTTSRTDVYVEYLEVITGDLGSLLFGQGLSSGSLYRDPHNLYIEITYYIGLIGLFLFLFFYGTMIHAANNSSETVAVKQRFVSKYLVLIMIFVLYFTLHGIFQMVTYAGFFLTFLSLLIVPKNSEKMKTEENMLRVG